MAIAGIATAGIVGTAPAAELSVQADAEDALIVGDAPKSVTVAVEREAGDDGAYELRQRFVDRYGEVTEGPTLEVPRNQDVWRQRVEVPVEHYGPATYHASLYERGGEEPVAEAEQMLIRPVPVPRLTAAERAESPIGINVHANAHWETLGAMGIHWARDYSWGWLGHGETLPKAANGTDFTNVLPDAERAGITILPVMQQAFRTEDKKLFITDGDVIAAAYERLSDAYPEIPYWELDNEADLQYRDQTSEDYKRWFETYLGYIEHADRGLEKAGNGAEVVLNGEAGIHLDRTQELIERVGDHFAVVNYHFYTGTVAPELAQEDTNKGGEDRPRTISFLDQARQINQLAHEAGKEAWLTEIGWSARSGAAIGDRLQSAYLQRIYLLARWAGTDKVFWFWDRELPPGGRFSSMELIHSKEGARPAGAAMAAVSKFTAQARYLGSVDIGPDRWCLVFERPEGDYLAAAWAVESEHDLPAALAEAESAFGMYGNLLREARLTAEPAYFELAQLPEGWRAQFGVEWLSPRIVNVYQDGEAGVEVATPADTRLNWQDLPEGARGSDAGSEGERRTATLRALPELNPGTYRVAAVVEGEGWQKRFPLTLKVRPAVEVEATPYRPGESSRIRLSNAMEAPFKATLEAAQGEVRPESLSLTAGGDGTATFEAPADATDAIELTVTLDNGAEQRAWIRPGSVRLPRATGITVDGDLSDWPAGGVLGGRMLERTGPVEDFDPRIRLAWSPEGLYVAATIPVGEDLTPPAKPGDFWEWTSLEMSFDAVGSGEDEKHPHLLWFTPTRGGADEPWRVYAGEWQKPMPDGEKKTIQDDDRSRTAMRYEGREVVMEVLIPVEVLGVVPRAGAAWPLTINAKVAKALSPRTVAVWPGEGRGQVIFTE